MQSGHIAYSYLANVPFETEFGGHQGVCTIPSPELEGAAYVPNQNPSGTREFGVYQSFGTTEIFESLLPGRQKIRAVDYFEEIKENLDSKLAVEALKVNGVWVGDLIYDTYLMTQKKATIDPLSSSFRGFLHSSLELFFFLDRLLRRK